MSASLDHLVIAAATLAEGVAWCETTLGVTPGPGGEHALFGTHNRLLKLHCDSAPNAYLEIIAINPGAQPTRAAPLKRWFDLDDPALQARLREHGPQLMHWVASVHYLPNALAQWKRLGIARGEALTASRATLNGLLEWQISVRGDGQRLFEGCLPTLIQWGHVHPAHSMPASGVALRQFGLRHPEAQTLEAALPCIGLNSVRCALGAAQLQAELITPQGPVTLVSSNLQMAI
ncbi:MAG: VOC family protein [Hydrogenophaga sp.]